MDRRIGWSAESIKLRAAICLTRLTLLTWWLCCQARRNRGREQGVALFWPEIAFASAMIGHGSGAVVFQTRSILRRSCTDRVGGGAMRLDVMWTEVCTHSHVHAAAWTRARERH
jgi:hypothetical protein